MKQVLFILISLSLCSIGAAQINSASVAGTLKNSDPECQHLIFKIGNGMNRMPAIAIKNLSEARVEMNDFSKSFYTLQKFTITILCNETHTFETFTNEGNVFTEKTKTFLSTVKPNDVVMVSGITAVDLSGKMIYVQERNLGIY